MLKVACVPAESYPAPGFTNSAQVHRMADVIEDEWLCASLICFCFFPFTAFQTEGKLYLILDFLRGGDVFTRLSKEVSVLFSSVLTL